MIELVLARRRISWRLARQEGEQAPCTRYTKRLCSRLPRGLNARCGAIVFCGDSAEWKLLLLRTGVANRAPYKMAWKP